MLLLVLLLAAVQDEARLEEIVRALDADDAAVRSSAQVDLESFLDREPRGKLVRDRLKGSSGEVRGRLQEALDLWDFRRGDRIALVRVGRIWVMSSRGKFARQLTTEGESLAPAFSPDGRRIAFSSNRSGAFEIHLIDVDGKNEVQLTRFRTGSFDPVFSPDGKRVVYSGEGAGKGIRSVDLTGHDPAELHPWGEWPSFSPDGRQLLLTGRVRTAQGNVFLLPIGAKGEPRPLTDVFLPMGLNYHARFSPDGSRIVFAGWNPGGGSGLFTAKSDGTERKVLRKSGSFYAWPSFSPDGTRVLCCRTSGEPLGMTDRHFLLEKPRVVLLEEGKEDVDLGEGAYPVWGPGPK